MIKVKIISGYKFPAIQYIKALVVLQKKMTKLCFFSVLMKDFHLQLRKVVQEWPTVLLPSHRSYLDFLLVSFIMFEHNMKLPCIAAGQGTHTMLYTETHTHHTLSSTYCVLGIPNKSLYFALKCGLYKCIAWIYSGKSLLSTASYCTILVFSRS